MALNHDFGMYEWTKEYHLIVTSANADRQLMRASWPLNISAKLLSIRVSNLDGSVSGGQVVLWDQDLSNTTPTTRGSAGQAIAVFGVVAAVSSGAAATTIEYGINGGPTPEFFAGIALQGTRLGMHIAAQILHTR